MIVAKLKPPFPVCPYCGFRLWRGHDPSNPDQWARAARTALTVKGLDDTPDKFQRDPLRALDTVDAGDGYGCRLCWLEEQLQQVQIDGFDEPQHKPDYWRIRQEEANSYLYRNGPRTVGGADAILRSPLAQEGAPGLNPPGFEERWLHDLVRHRSPRARVRQDRRKRHELEAPRAPRALKADVAVYLWRPSSAHLPEGTQRYDATDLGGRGEKSDPGVIWVEHKESGEVLVWDHPAMARIGLPEEVPDLAEVAAGNDTAGRYTQEIMPDPPFGATELIEAEELDAGVHPFWPPLDRFALWILRGSPKTRVFLRGQE